MNEHEIQTYMMNLLKLEKVLVFRINQGRRGHIKMTSREGLSDLIGITPKGKFFAVECKAYKGKLSEAQIEFMDDIVKNNGLAYVVYDIGECGQVAQILKQT